MQLQVHERFQHT